MTTQAAQLETALLDAVLADPVCAAVLERVPALGLGEWWLTAGAIFQNVWNSVEGRPAGYGIKDYDVFYYDDSDLSWEAEDTVIRAAGDLLGDVPATIEVRNEARVHLWYAEKFGTPAPPFTSATDAVDAFAACQWKAAPSSISTKKVTMNSAVTCVTEERHADSTSCWRCSTISVPG